MKKVSVELSERELDILIALLSQEMVVDGRYETIDTNALRIFELNNIREDLKKDKVP